MNILRSMLLASTALREKPDDQGVDNRTAAQKERDSITVDVTNGRKEGDVEGGDDNTADDENDEDEGEEDDSEESEEGEGEGEGKETDEEKAARIAQEKEERRQSRIQKRIDKLTASNKNYETEIANLKKQLEAKPIEGVTEEDIERMAEERANKKLQEKLQKDAETEFFKMCDRLESEATKVDKNFIKKLEALVKELEMPVPGTLMTIVNELDNENGGAVLNYLTDNPDEAEEIYKLSERKMTQRLIRISDKLKDTVHNVKPERKRSNVPEPVSPISERSTNSDLIITGKESMDDFARKRAKQVEERRKARGY